MSDLARFHRGCQQLARESHCPACGRPWRFWGVVADAASDAYRAELTCSCDHTFFLIPAQPTLQPPERVLVAPAPDFLTAEAPLEAVGD